MSFIDRLRERLFRVKTPDFSEIQKVNVRDNYSKNKASEMNEFQAGKSESGVNAVSAEGAFPSRVLFICSGNMCRSPYAAARFLMLAKGRSVQVMSAGTLRLTGRRAALEMIETARERGLNLDEHRSSALTKMLIQASDVIFVMEHSHRLEVIRICAEAEPRLVMLGKWLPEPKDELEDPMGKDPEVYRSVADEIDTALECWFEQWK